MQHIPSKAFDATPQARHTRLFDLMQQSLAFEPKDGSGSDPQATAPVTEAEAHAFLNAALRSFGRAPSRETPAQPRTFPSYRRAMPAV